MSDTDIRFRKLLRSDFPLLAHWLGQAHVARWWNHLTSPEALERDFGDAVDNAGPAGDLIALNGDDPIGLMQISRLSDYPEYRAEFQAIIAVPDTAMTIDYLIGEGSHTGRGLGTAMIRAAVQETWREWPQASAILTAVVVTNSRSWRALERAGFERIAEGDMEPDNPIDTKSHFVYRIDRPA